MKAQSNEIVGSKQRSELIIWRTIERKSAPQKHVRRRV